MFKDKHRFKIDSVAVFMLGAIFLFLSIGLVVFGGSIYHNIVETSNQNDQSRVALAYFSNQVRRADLADSLEIGQLYDTEALLLKQNYDGYQYITYLYCYEGKLYEQFVEQGYEVEPNFGTAIMDMQSLAFNLENGLLSIDFKFEDGRTDQAIYTIHTQVLAEGGI